MRMRIKNKIDSLTNWTSNNPILLRGEIGCVENDGGIAIKIGNGETTFNELPYYEEQIFSRIYPVGSIYMSVVETNPATLFGGEWERLKDTFLLAAGDTYELGAVGGEATHTLTVSELPNHVHAQLGVKGFASNTSPVYQNYQDDGNVVVYDKDDMPLWQSASMTTNEKVFRQTIINKDGATGGLEITSLITICRRTWQYICGKG